MPKFIDLSGQVFGNWHVLEYAGNSKWLCECQCENKTIREVLGKTLRNGKSKSCGCLNKVDITDKQFGDWIVIKQLNSDKVLCKCKLCNKNYEVRISNLKSGSSTKCINCSHKLSGKLPENLINKQFNNWKVLSYSGDGYWLCECQCENKTKQIIKTADLKRGSTKSCGCKSFRDLTKENTDIEVIKYIGRGYWQCKCNYCGNLCKIHRTEIINGQDNCGCQRIQRQKETMLKRYGDESQSKIGNPRTIEQQEAIKSRDSLDSFIQANFDYKPTTYELSIKLGISSDRVLKIIHNLGMDDSIKINSGSHFEDEIYNILLESIPKNKIIRHDREILKGKELDIYIPEKKLAIEFNGNYWHSSDFCDINEHQNKTLDCAKQGIRLIHIFEYEWINNKSKIISLIHMLIHESTSVYARNTVVREIDTFESREFLNKYHLQGSIDSNINIGCFYNDLLIGIMTIGKPRFNQHYQYEILRMCWKQETKVCGGLEKIFNYFIKNYNPQSIITYSDISKFTGNSYLKIGFKPIQPNTITKPNYVWVDIKKNIVLNRYKTMKHKLIELGIGAEDQTEDEIMKHIGYYKVYDSGNIKLEWKKGEDL